MNFSFGLPKGYQRVLMRPNFHGKYRLVQTRALQERNGLEIGCKFVPSLV